MKMPITFVAVREGVSKNKVKYTAKELKKTAHELEGRPILKDHEAKCDNVIGTITNSYFSEEDKAVLGKGLIMDEKIKEMINDGRLKEVSIGAIADQMVKESEDDDIDEARGIHYQELSIVPVPGVSGTEISASEKLKEENKMNLREQEPAPQAPAAAPQQDPVQLLAAKLDQIINMLQSNNAPAPAPPQEQAPEDEDEKKPEEADTSNEQPTEDELNKVKKSVPGVDSGAPGDMGKKKEEALNKRIKRLEEQLNTRKSKVLTETQPQENTKINELLRYETGDFGVLERTRNGVSFGVIG